MQQFRLDEKVLYRDRSNDLPWLVTSYGCTVKGKHALQCGVIVCDSDILPYYGNEYLLGRYDEPNPDFIPRQDDLVAVSLDGSTWFCRKFVRYNDTGNNRVESRCRFICQGLEDSRKVAYRYCRPLAEVFSVPTTEDGALYYR